MTFSPMFLMEILFGVAILGFALWQVISLSPKRIAAEEAKKQAEQEKASLKNAKLEKASGHPEG
ncbi:MAG TPA: hypothetical protein DIU09_11670 [Hyphomonadaceae bacterium]|uniref:hypothetical protein n=1 Tax=Aquidulcibacter sp. TaxID=2052990 RepID=UPI00078D1DF0|nr:hypothetical protein [Aquidulcibacter sp.]AMS30392.1 hypothetical protein AEM38_14610 [Hyphomonadaceae bacterium UKL13-1]MCA3695629.1 hypothetical protein [Aquidulcibacter sp.]HCP65233.1 hypothetical protein [Hyphomonadaceae bacterium]